MPLLSKLPPETALFARPTDPPLRSIRPAAVAPALIAIETGEVTASVVLLESAAPAMTAPVWLITIPPLLVVIVTPAPEVKVVPLLSKLPAEIATVLRSTEPPLMSISPTDVSPALAVIAGAVSVSVEPESSRPSARMLVV